MVRNTLRLAPHHPGPALGVAKMGSAQARKAEVQAIARGLFTINRRQRGSKAR